MLLTALLSQALTEGKVRLGDAAHEFILIALDPQLQLWRDLNLEGHAGSSSTSVTSWWKANICAVNGKKAEWPKM